MNDPEPIPAHTFNIDDEDFSLFHAATLFGKIHGEEIDLSDIGRQIANIAKDVRAATEPDADSLRRVGSLLRVFFQGYGFTGDSEEYDAPVNSFIHKVLQRRRGLPISLSLIFCEVARRVGIDAYGIAFPGHFLVGIHFERSEGGRDLRVIDPFHGGQFRDRGELSKQLSRVANREVSVTAEHLVPAHPRTILERILNNLRASYRRRNDFRGLLHATTHRLILKPGDPPLLLERAHIKRLTLDFHGAAADAQKALELGEEITGPEAAAFLLKLRNENLVIH